MAISRWLEIDALLSPIIGQPGVAALFERSVHLSCAIHPCLASVPHGTFEHGDFGSLRHALAQESGADAAAANDALLCTFQALLTNLIGGPLAERLLGDVWRHPTGGASMQEAAP